MLQLAHRFRDNIPRGSEVFFPMQIRGQHRDHLVDALLLFQSCRHCCLFTFTRLKQLQEEFIWKLLIRKPCRVLSFAISCSPRVANKILQHRDTYQLPTAHLMECLRSYDENPWTCQLSKLFLYPLDFLSLRQVELPLKLLFSHHIKSNGSFCR